MARELHERFGAAREQVERAGLFGALPDPLTLLRKAYEAGPSDPDVSRVYLAAAMLSASERTSDGRLAAALKVASRIVAAYSSPELALGPEGDRVRDDALPGGWMGALTNWERFRYAWLRGMDVLLGAERDERLRGVVDELVRMDGGEREPMRVAIQEKWPPDEVAVTLSVLGIGLSAWGIYRELRRR